MRRPEKTLPTLLGLVLVVGGLVATVAVLGGGPVRLWIQAEEEVQPVEIRITNITHEGVVMTWATNVAATGWVRYKEDKLTARELVASDERDETTGEFGKYLTHLVSVKNLKPETGYKIRVGSGRQLGREFVVKTGPRLRNLPRAEIVYGQVLTAGGDPAEGAMVYIAMPGTGLMATLVKASGSWVIPIALTRITDNRSYAKYGPQSALSILVRGGVLGSAEISTTVEKAYPLQPVKLVLPKP